MIAVNVQQLAKHYNYPQQITFLPLIVLPTHKYIKYLPNTIAYT